MVKLNGYTAHIPRCQPFRAYIKYIHVGSEPSTVFSAYAPTVGWFFSANFGQRKILIKENNFLRIFFTLDNQLIR